MAKLAIGQKRPRVSGRKLLAKTLGRAFDTGQRQGLLLSKVFGQTIARQLLEGKNVSIPFLGTFFYAPPREILLYSHQAGERIPQMIYPKVRFTMHKGLKRLLKETAIERMALERKVKSDREKE